MSYLATRAEAAIVACTEASNQPTKDQVAEIAQLTRSEQVVLEKVQQTLFKRIVQPESFLLREVENTLIVVQQCLFIGSLAFVTFFKERIYAIAALTNYTSLSSNSHMITRVQRKARQLSQLLQNDERLQRERQNSVIPTTTEFPSHIPFSPVASNPQSPNRGRPLRTWRDWRSSSSSSTPPIPTYLPTPEPSPERGSSQSDDGEPRGRNLRDDGQNFEYSTGSVWDEIEQSGRRQATRAADWSSASSDIDRAKMEAMAKMTFDREQLGILVRVLVERLIDHGHDATHSGLIKALTIIKHCLLRGSESFTAWFRESQAMIAVLRDFPDPAVSRLAKDVLHHLDDGPDADSIGEQTPPTSPAASTLSDLFANIDLTATPLREPVKDLTAFISTVGEHPIASGGYALVYRATLRVGQLTEVVAKKVLSSYQISPARRDKRFNRELRTWTRLDHPNIARLYGLTRETNGSLGLISHFFRNGNIEEYLKGSGSSVNVLRLMVEITLGVEYLHEQHIVHGDIKGSNIMVDDAGHAKLIDFGLSRITGESGNTTSGPGISLAFAAPELLLIDDEGPIVKTTSSDMYALAITFVQIMSGRTPYRGMPLYNIMNWVKLGGVPERPMPDDEGCIFIPEDDLWALLLCCWAPRPGERPAISTVREVLMSLDDSA